MSKITKIPQHDLFYRRIWPRLRGHLFKEADALLQLEGGDPHKCFKQFFTDFNGQAATEVLTAARELSTQSETLDGQVDLFLVDFRNM